MIEVVLRETEKVKITAEVGVKFVDIRHAVYRADTLEWKLLNHIHLGFDDLWKLVSAVFAVKAERIQKRRYEKQAAKRAQKKDGVDK